MPGWVLAALILAAPESGVSVAQDCTDARRIDFSGERALELTTEQLQSGRLWIEELGAQVQVRQGTTLIDINGGPVRYGVAQLDLRQKQPLVLSTRAGSASVRIASDCPGFGDAASLPWWQQLQQTTAAIDPRAAAESPEFEALISSARTPFQMISAMHVRAYRTALLGNHRQAVQAYLQVAERWTALGDASRAGAATLGAADAAYATSSFAQALTHARTAYALLQGRDDLVFRQRAAETECRSQQSLGHIELALDCFASLGKAYTASGNLDGLTNVLYATALMEYARGELNAAIAAEQQALALDPQRVLPVARGRILLQQARRLVDAGQVAAAVEAYARAMDLFAQSRETGKDWEAEALSKLARLYAKLGMADTAYRAAARLLGEVAAHDDPSQVASLLVTLSHIEEAGQRPQAALHWAQVGGELFGVLQRPAGQLETRLREAELRLRHDLQPAQLQQLEALDQTQMSSTDRNRVALIRSLQALQLGDLPASEHLAAAVDETALDSEQRNLQIAVRVRALMAAGQSAQALDAVIDGIASGATLATLANNSGLGWVAMRVTAALRPMLVDVWLESPPTQRSIAQFWNTWLQSLPTRAIRPGNRVADSFSASAAVAREFLYGTQGLSTHAALARSMGQAADRGAPSSLPLPTLEALQARLAPGELLLVLASGSRQSLLLQIRRDQILSSTLPDRQILLDAVLAFSTLVQQRGSRNTELDKARIAVEQLLLPGLSGPRPRRLLVLLDDVLANLPISALHWPGDQEPLVAHIPVTYVSDVRSGDYLAVPRTTSQQSLQVLVASKLDAASARLPHLQGAELEPELIRSAMPAAQLRLWRMPEAGRVQLLEQLEQPGAWLHLASHGWSEPGAFGHAGVWLSGATATAEPQFLSWLDVADHAIAADLVVLNACQLATTDVHAVSQGSMSFALTVSAAGARNTVAAFWPVSDAATGIWVPQFYGWMAGRDADASAQALRQAQQALRQSRNYRHPYYWASLGHFQRLDVPLP